MSTKKVPAALPFLSDFLNENTFLKITVQWSSINTDTDILFERQSYKERGKGKKGRKIGE